MSSNQIVWTGYTPFYQNKDTSNEYNPVELMAYIPFSSPTTVIRGIGVKVSDDNVSGFALWTADLQENGELGPDNDPTFIPSVTIIEAEVRLPANMVAVAWGLKASSKNASNVVIWARRWNSSTLRLEGDAISYNYAGDDSVEMSTPVPEDSQQIIMGFGAGVKSDDVNRIAAGYATLAPAPSSSQVPVIWGSVSSNGDVVAGMNFAVKRSGIGEYQLYWENQPNIVPVIGVTSGVRSVEGEGSDNVFSFSNVTSAGATVTSTDVGGNNDNLEDEAFSFVAFFPITDIPGLLFGEVDSDGNRMTGSSGWSSIKTGTGAYLINFDRTMEPAPNLIMTAGSNGDNNVISNAVPNTIQAKVFSQDVGNGSSNSENSVFSFFAWNINVLPTDPLTSQLKAISSARILPGQNAAMTTVSVTTKDEIEESAFSVLDQLGDGHWQAKFNFPLPEVPIAFTSAVQTSGSESNGAKRIASIQNPTTTGYELWSIKVGDGHSTPTDGGMEVTVAMPDQFPLP